MTEFCHCGKPLHYNSPASENLVRNIIAAAGDEYVNITVGNVTWRVQRHYIALHGIRGSDLPTLGFEMVECTQNY